MSDPWWIALSGRDLAQGDLLEDCHLPVYSGTEDGESVEQVKKSRLIIITQSCDLVNKRVEFVALCPVHRLEEFERFNPEFARKGEWEPVRKGRREGLHLLASPENPADNRSALVVDFGHIVSLPIGYLSGHAGSVPKRWRLRSPFLEHFSQAFARFFMRVGLPSDIPPYK